MSPWQPMQVYLFNTAVTSAYATRFGLGEGDGDGEGEAFGLGLGEGETFGLGLGDGEGEAFGLALGLGDGEGEALGGVGLGELLAVGVGDAPTSVASCAEERDSPFITTPACSNPAKRHPEVEMMMRQTAEAEPPLKKRLTRFSVPIPTILRGRGGRFNVSVGTRADSRLPPEAAGFRRYLSGSKQRLSDI